MSREGRLRAGVIGLGWAGQQHLAGYADAADVDLTALAGLETDALQQLGAAYDIPNARRYTDWRDLIDHEQPDVLSIATPTTLHAPIAVAARTQAYMSCVRSRWPKTPHTARLMVEAAERNDRVLDVSFNHRRRGHVQVLKQMIDAGVLGKIYYAKAGWLRREGIPGLGSWFTRRAISGGGPLMDLGVHMLDIALYLLDEPRVRAVTAATYAEFGPRGKGGSFSPFMRKTGRSPAPSTSKTSRLLLFACRAAERCCWSRAGLSGSRRITAT